MRFIVKKFIDAANASEAIAKDAVTPVHDCYLKDGEEPKRSEDGRADAIGFRWTPKPGYYENEAICHKK